MDAKFRKLCIDAYNGVPTAFAEGNPTDVIVNRIKEANNGSTVLDYKAIRDGKCPELYSVIEELVEIALDVAPLQDSPIRNMIEEKRYAWGDKPEFYIKDNSLLAIDVVTNGTQGIRRQRYLGGQKIPVNPVTKAVKIYEELILLLAGRVDWAEFVKLNNLTLGRFDIAATGTASESALLELIEKVEAATGKKATILGTMAALRSFTLTNVGEKVRDDYYNMGYAGMFNGTPAIRLRNSLDASDNFILSDKRIYVVTGDDKIFKHYVEGEPILISRDATDNADLTQEYTVIRREGVAVIVSETMGVYNFT